MPSFSLICDAYFAYMLILIYANIKTSLQQGHYLPVYLYEDSQYCLQEVQEIQIFMPVGKSCPGILGLLKVNDQGKHACYDILSMQKLQC